MDNKKLFFGGVAVIIIGLGFFVLIKQSTPIVESEPQTSTSAIVEKKITLIGIVKQLNNNSDPAQYSYELTLNYPFFDEFQSTRDRDPYVNNMPILSRDKDLQDSINGYVGKEVAMEGLMAWGLAESRYLEVSTISDLTNWKTYTNKTFKYSLKYPEAYQVSFQTEKEKNQLGVDNNIEVERKSDPSGTSVIVIDVYQDNENISLGDYMNQNSKQLGITGPLLSDRFNGNKSLANKNQPGVNQFLKQGLYIYHLTAPTASQDKEIADIVATFRFTK